MKAICRIGMVLLVGLGNLKAQVKTPKADIDNFMDKRFGMFIHFGPVTLRGTEIGWSRGDQVSIADYDSLYKEFNPVLFNADEWVSIAKAAGMKYLTITAKHHDGFCLWPTAFSGYNITHSPFKRDIVGELAKACKKKGITFCIYFTVLDWHDADYGVHRGTTDSTGNMPVFVNRMKNQLKELITRYKPAMLWFDGYWEKPWTSAYGREVYQYIKSVDPHVVVNNRLGKDYSKLQGDEVVGDYLTPEQAIGKLNMNEPWESCITICNQWAWKPNDSMKSLKECIQTLVKSAGGNGNLLFNVGPMMDGRIEARQVDRLRMMGAWLNSYGTAIYQTKGGPYQGSNSYVSTRKGNKIYIHLLNNPNGTMELPGIPGAHLMKAYLMNGPAIAYTQNSGGAIRISLPQQLPDENVSVLVLELDKDAETLPII